MANIFTRFLGGVANGLTSPKGLVSNWQHATRLFVDDTFRLAPKHKFNYYVRFEIDPTANKASAFTTKNSEEASLLVKSCDLPKFSFDTSTLNQYNRKKLIYSNFNYEPVSLTFHDDNNGVVNALWAIYYGYYIRDRHITSHGYSSTHYRPTDTELDSYRYGLDSNISVPLFRSVSIYTMGRRRFVGYTLVNPKITQWQHGVMDHYASADMAESNMTLQYEAVQYSSGSVSYGSPKGFATLHYDTTPSPLSVAGGGITSLLGEGGVLDGLEQVFGNIASGAAFDSPAGFLGTVAAGINTYQNAKNLTGKSLISEGFGLLSSPGGITAIAGGITGVAGAVFPKNDDVNTATVATQKTIVNSAWDFKYDPVAEGEVGAGDN